MSSLAYSATPQPSFDRLLNALTSAGCEPKVRHDGRHLDARCPLPDHAHGDRNRSLSLDYRDDRTFLLCHRCGRDATAAILAALSLAPRDLYDTPHATSTARTSHTRRPTQPTPPKASTSTTAAATTKTSSTSRNNPTRVIIARYDYADADGTPVLRVLRYDPKGFSQQQWSGTRWVRGSVPRERRVLYRLRDVLAAAEAGTEVWVCEGEKDADALAAAGVTATTAPMGAKKWEPQYTEQLTGTQVVICVDRDHLDDGPGDAGAQHAALVRDELRAAGINVRCLEAATGKDPADHLAAGHDTAAFITVSDDTLNQRVQAATATTAPHDQPTEQPSGAREPRYEPLPNVVELHTGGLGEQDAPDNSNGIGEIAAIPTAGILGGNKAQFERRHNELVQVRHEKVSGAFVQRVDTVLGCLVRIACIEQMGDAAGEVRTTHYVLALARTQEEPEVEQRVTVEDFESCVWLADLPWPNVYYRTTTRDRDAIRTAIRMTSPTPRIERRHDILGWTTGPDQTPMYVHAAGGINATGHVPLSTGFMGTLAQMVLPEPSTDPTVIRQAAEHSLCLLDKLPARIGAVLAGAAYRSVLGFTQSVVLLRGLPGTYKTSLMNVSASHLGMDLTYYAATFSLTRTGHTDAGAAAMMHSVRDSLVTADDAAPDRSVSDAQTILSEIVRNQFNGTGRVRSHRKDRLQEPEPPQGTMLIAAEVAPGTASSVERAFEVAIAKNDVTPRAVLDLYNQPSRHGRARLMACYLQWLAPRLDESRDLLDTRRRELNAHLRSNKMTASWEDRTLQAVCEFAAGWWLLLRFLIDTGAYTPDEVTIVWHKAWQGLLETADRQKDPDAVVYAAPRFLKLLRGALSASAHLVDASGKQPADDAHRAGWTTDPRAIYRDPLAPQTPPAMIPRGNPIGVLGHDKATGELRAWLNEDLALAAARTIARSSGEPFEASTGMIREALDQFGVLHCDVERKPSGATTRRRTVNRPLPGGARGRALDVSWAALWAEEDDPNLETVNTPPLNPSGAGDTASPPKVNDTVEEGQQLDTGDLPQQSASTGEANDFFLPTIDTGEWGPPLDEDGAVEELAAPRSCQVCGDESWTIVFGQVLHINECVTTWEMSRLTSPEAVASPHTARITPANSAINPAIGSTINPAIEPSASPSSTPSTATASPATDAHPSPQQQPTRSAATSAASAKRYLAPAAIVDATGVYLPGGEIHPLPTMQHLGQLVDLVTELRLGHGGDAVHLPDLGQLWLTASAVELLELPTTITDDPDHRSAAFTKLNGNPVVDLARAQGWNFGNTDKNSPTGRLDGWTRMWSPTNRSGAFLVVIPWQMEGQNPMLNGDPHPAALAERLSRYAHETGITYRISPAATGVDLIEHARPRSTNYAERDAHDLPRVALAGNLEADYRWHRTLAALTPSEQTTAWVHGYDRGGSYLAATSSVRLGTGPAEHHSDGRTFDPATPGYWRLADWTWETWTSPNPATAAGELLPNGTRWVTTPTAALLTELGFDVDPLEAWTWAESVRYLEPWYKRLRDARSALQSAAEEGDDEARVVLSVVKSTYSGAIGKLGQQSGENWTAQRRRLWRPDWRHQVIATSKAAISRRINKIGESSGQWPVVAVTDAVFYLSDDPNPVTAWPGDQRDLGTGLGKYKAIGSTPLAEWKREDGSHFLNDTRFRLTEATDTMTLRR